MACEEQLVLDHACCRAHQRQRVAVVAAVVPGDVDDTEHATCAINDRRRGTGQKRIAFEVVLAGVHHHRGGIGQRGADRVGAAPLFLPVRSGAQRHALCPLEEARRRPASATTGRSRRPAPPCCRRRACTRTSAPSPAARGPPARAGGRAHAAVARPMRVARRACGPPAPDRMSGCAASSAAARHRSTARRPCHGRATAGVPAALDARVRAANARGDSSVVSKASAGPVARRLAVRAGNQAGLSRFVTPPAAHHTFGTA